MSSEDTLASNFRFANREMAAVVIALLLLGITAAFYTYSNGHTLYYGDAQSHLNISRSLIDSRTPCYDQLGTVWLPLLHLVCLPFVSNDYFWRTGLAGTIPVTAAFVLAGTCLYAAARSLFGSAVSAAVVLSCFALNPNILYLAAIPMTEILFIAGLSVWLLAFIRYRTHSTPLWLVLAILASWAMSLCRYDGWFLIPFQALWFARVPATRKLWIFLILGAAGSLVPLYWFAHNWYEAGNALDFFNGPYSAQAIQAGHPYPGWHNWPAALLYYSAAGQLCAGWPLALLGLIGAVLAFWRKHAAILGFLCLTPAFYTWSIHSSQNPIFVPQLYPHSYYNTRYGIAVVVLAAFAVGGLAEMARQKCGNFVLILPLLCVAPWILHPDRHSWICWEESYRNSVARRAWMTEISEYLQVHYRQGDQVLTESGTGDISGAFGAASLPLKQVLFIGNGPLWAAATSRPDLYHPAAWAIAQKGDSVSRALARLPSSPYRLVHIIDVPGAKRIEIYSRSLAGTLDMP